MICNICDGISFREVRGRPNAECVNCGSRERTRAIFELIERYNLLGSATRVLHFSPELGLSDRIKAKVGQELYDSYDLNPQNYSKCIGVKKFDLTVDAHLLPSRKYDLIIHSHVMEHIHSWVAPVLWHIHRSLTRSGTHLFCIPISMGHSTSNIGPLSKEERNHQFGQSDHVRRFGHLDIDKTIGAVFRLSPETNGLPFDESTAIKYGINIEKARREIFMMKKDDLLLTEQ